MSWHLWVKHWTTGARRPRVSGGVENRVDEAGEVWSDTFMRMTAAHLAGAKKRPRAMPPSVGL